MDETNSVFQAPSRRSAPGQIQHFCRQIAQLHLMAHGRQLLGEVAKAAAGIQDAQRPVARRARQASMSLQTTGGANAPLVES
jgi:hypothetical protein